MIAHPFVNNESRNFRRLIRHLILIDADNRLLAALDSFLILISGLLNLALRKSFLDSFDHSAHRLNLAEIV